jgi:hypothetical protein
MVKKTEQTPGAWYRGLAYAVAIIAAGLALVYRTLFIYRGGYLDPPVLSRFLVIAGTLFLGVNLIFILRVKKWAFLFVVLLVVGTDSAVDYWARNLRQRIMEKSLKESSALIDAAIIKVTKPVMRKGRPRTYPHIVCEYTVDGKTYRQLYRINMEAPYEKGNITAVRYYPGNPRISILADEGLPAERK